MIHILYEDRFILVCRKLPGILSQAGPGPNLPELLEEAYGGTVYPVHRLDRETGGAMVFARTRSGAAALSEAIRQNRLRKEYCCVVRGVPQPGEGMWRDLLLHDKARNKSFVVQRMRGGVREAELDYRVIAAEGGMALVRVRLHTGRTIRFGYSLPAAGRLCWATANMGAAADRWPCGAACWRSHTRRQGKRCCSGISRRAGRGRFLRKLCRRISAMIANGRILDKAQHPQRLP